MPRLFSHEKSFDRLRKVLFRSALTIGLIVLVFGMSVGDMLLAANGSVTYSYDALGRIATASYDTGVFVTYTYDANGNRLSQTVNVNASTLTWTSAGSGSCASNCWGGALWQ